MNDLSDAFMNNNAPTTFVEPWNLAVEITAAEIGYQNLMKDFEKGFAAVFGVAMPSGPALSPFGSGPSVPPLRASIAIATEKTNGGR